MQLKNQNLTWQEMTRIATCNGFSAGIIGNGYQSYGITTCLLTAGFEVTLCTDNVRKAQKAISDQLNAFKKNADPNTPKKRSSAFAVAESDSNKDDHDFHGNAFIKDCLAPDLVSAERLLQQLRITPKIANLPAVQLVIIITPEDLAIKHKLIRKVDAQVDAATIITINSESIPLTEIQQVMENPSRLLALNWTEPVHTTRFLEIITNNVVAKEVLAVIEHLATQFWQKKPYVVEELGIRSRLMSAMIREAFYLVENGYASIDDIDRACRNDAGYYLPFAGNLRYMDLMGTYAYGMVMKDLNAHLSKEKVTPAFFEKILENNGQGIKNGKGLYHYNEGEIQKWREIFEEFSFKIQKVIDAYPFDFK